MTLEIGIVITLIAYAVLTVVGFFAILERAKKDTNEQIEKVKQEATKMHEAQEQRIVKAEQAAIDIRDNYNKKFALVYENQHKSDMDRTEQNAALETKLIKEVRDVEENIRHSHHKHADEVNKALLHINVSLTEIKTRIAKPRRRIV